VAATLGLVLLLAPPTQAQTRHNVTQVVATVSFAFLPVYIAEHMGYFNDEGVDLKTVTTSSAQAGLATVASGDAAYYLSTPVAGARSAGQGARIINCGALMTQNPTNIVVSSEVAQKLNLPNDVSSIPVDKRITMLKGLRLAAHTAGSSPDQTLRFVARKGGLDPERDIQILPIVGSAILAALEQKRIDGFAYSSPLADTAVVKQGARTLFSFASGDYSPLAGQLSISMVCSRDWLEKDPEGSAATLRAIWRAMRLMRTNAAEAKAAAKKAFPALEDSIFNAAFDTNSKAFPDNPRLSKEQMEEAIAFHKATGGAPFAAKIEDTFTNAAVDRATKTMK